MDFEFITPPQIEENAAAKQLYLRTMKDIASSYNSLADNLKKANIESGMEERAAEKKAIEDARYVLPNACTTK